MGGTGEGMGKGTWIIDLDGVIWLAYEPIPGSAEAVARLRDAGYDVFFASNNSSPTLGHLVERLAAVGIDVTTDDVATSAQAAASILEPGSTALVCGDEGVVEALEARGVTVVERGPADAVVVGWTRRFDFELLATSASAVRAGARLVGTNEDPTHPTPRGLQPGSGALLAAVATAAQATPEIAGKPHGPFVALLHERAPDGVLVVGDRPSTDGVLAHRLRLPYALVRTGVTSDGREPMVVEADEDAEDLLTLVRRHLGD
jgi:HAD superfamily hydrolase (TIGR01450 family)